MGISKVKQGAYTELDSQAIGSLLQRTPSYKQVSNTMDTIPRRLDVTGYIYKRCYELEKQGIPKYEICGIISKELRQLGHDDRRARRVLGPEYKRAEFDWRKRVVPNSQPQQSPSNEHRSKRSTDKQPKAGI